MNRRIPVIAAVIIIVLSLISCSGQENTVSDPYVTPVESSHEPDSTMQPDPENEINDIVPETDPLVEAITAAIIGQNQGKYLPGECYGVGYKIIETIEVDDTLSIYALTEYAEYRFEDDVFVSISGSNPNVLMCFSRTEDAKLDLIFYTRLDIFSDLPEEEIEALLKPLSDSGKDYLYTEQDLLEVRAQADEDAAEYLKSIGRIAEIRVRQEHDGQRLEELALNEDFVMELLKDEELSLYPYWTGTTERIEDGVRYIYQTAFNEEKQEITYTKIEYGTDKVVNIIAAYVQNGTVTQLAVE